MKIRKANKFDTEYFIKTVLNLQQADHNQFVSDVELDTDYLTLLFHQILAGQGVAYVATDEKKPIGICVGVLMPNLWNLKSYFMHQIIMFVEEEYRYTRAAYDLISKFTDDGKKMVKDGRILNYTFNVSEPMFNLKMNRFGYEIKEMTWMGGL